ncbi:OmpA family protein [Chryseobacterium indoltheticum]|uniref:OmpA family protein n=1 Tax=Chryseobacterium indoltheticum TaxID=254 RepID=UPI003F497DF3
MAIPVCSYAQDSIQVTKNTEYPNTFSSGSANVEKFKQSSKRFNDWSISFGAGVPLMQYADLTSLKFGKGAGKSLVGYSAYFSVDKAISHTFGLKLQYDRGETRQGAFYTRDAAPANASLNRQYGGRTQYDAISILGDINLTNIFRRVDNKSPYRWALHGYAGFGTIGYRAYLKDETGQRLVTEVKPIRDGLSFFGQGGAGLKYKINKRWDIEGRVMYVVTTDDTFDGGNAVVNTYKDNNSDNFVNATLGLTLKLGKHDSHLMWHDPMQEVYHRTEVLESKIDDLEACKAGDADNDGVCDDWDRQLDTLAGARVDGSGVALDVDMDGVIDLYDKCVTVPGPVENSGCPVETSNQNSGTVAETETKLDGIEFDLNSDRILPNNTPILNNAVNYINTSNGAYTVIGATDTRGSDAYNQNLSEKRANNVKQYLIKNGVESSKLDAQGNGKKDLKYPECDPASKCPEWKNKANRRVYFKAK